VQKMRQTSGDKPIVATVLHLNFSYSYFSSNMVRMRYGGIAAVNSQFPTAVMQGNIDKDKRKQWIIGTHSIISGTNKHRLPEYFQ
jgi:hypothetical protein